MSFTLEEVGADDRVVVFFAGHGHTAESHRAAVGFLVPYEGDTSDLNTLLRWDDLTRNADLVRAKHLLFIMDACYGGLAVPRTARSGWRFAKDMLRRHSRQVITAGKADEVVSDAGGPRPGHSVFTGHLLDAMDGAATTPDGLITASLVMSYVYQNVARDLDSNQTPHYGLLDGDGDMILNDSELPRLEGTDGTDVDILVESTTVEREQVDALDDSEVGSLKAMLADSSARISLFDKVIEETRQVLTLTNPKEFPVQGVTVDDGEIGGRLRKYEAIVSRLNVAVILLSRWGEAEHRGTLSQVFSRLPDAHAPTGGSVLLLGLRWYPATFLLYSAGIAALSAENYENLRCILEAPVGDERSGEGTVPIVFPAVRGMLDANRARAFNMLPGHERHKVARSEYLFKVVQPGVEDLLFLGLDYERLYDRLEILLALTYADLTKDKRMSLWGPPGRFAWKYSSLREERNPYNDLLVEAGKMKESWPPLVAGMFSGSYDRFVDTATRYREEILDKLGWF